METKNDTIHDTIVVIQQQDAHDISDSALVEEVIHRYDKVAHDLKSHDSMPAIITILSLIALIVGIINRRYKSRKNG